MRPQPFDRAVETGKRLAQPRQQHPPRGGQFDRAVQPVELLDAEVLVDRVKLMAAGRRRDKQFGGGPAEAVEAGGGLEGAQSAQRGQTMGRHQMRNSKCELENLSFAERGSDTK